MLLTRMNDEIGILFCTDKKCGEFIWNKGSNL